jgi:hypothetical protein
MPLGIRAQEDRGDQEKRDGGMTTREVDMLITKHATECVAELVNTVRREGQMPWFIIVERQMRKLAEELRRKPEKK